MVETVLGPIAAADLGVTSMHEHLLLDARILHAPSREPPPDDPRVTIENLGFVRWNLLALEDNLVLDDAALAVRELGLAAAEGQRAVVDLTAGGSGRSPRACRRSRARPACTSSPGAASTSTARTRRRSAGWGRRGSTELLRTALDDAIPGAAFRAGLLGLIGTSAPVTAAEHAALRAAGRAAAATGAAVTVRLDPAERRGHWVLDELGAVGCPPEQVIFGNVDEFLDLAYLGSLADAGATLEVCFGNEAYYRNGYKDPTDAERLAGPRGAARRRARRADRARLLGLDQEPAARLRRHGLRHLLRRIVPELARRGVAEDELMRMLVANPARLLDRA